MLREDGGGDAVGFLHFPRGALHGDDGGSGGLHRFLEAGAALLGVALFGEPLTPGRVVSLVGLVLSLVGLKLTA